MNKTMSIQINPEAGRELKKVVIDGVEQVVEDYSKTEPTTRAGKFFRKAGKLLAKIIPFAIFVKIKKNG